MRRFLTASLCVFLIASATASAKPGVQDIKDAKSPAWSAKATPTEMQVSVSPAGKSLRILGSSGIVLGAGADAVVNAKFRGPIRDALKDYNAAEVYRGIIKTKLEQALGKAPTEVAPLGSTAGAKSQDDVIKARYASLAKNGSDVLLDCVMTFGVYGADGTLATKLDAKLVNLPKGHKLWGNDIIATTDPILANADLGDPTSRGGVSLSADFAVNDEKVKRWTADGGAILKQRFEQAANAAVSAMIVDLGLGDDALGHYTLGVLLMNDKKYPEAAVHFKKAIERDPKLIDARNAHAVNLAHHKQVDDAIANAKSLTESNPDYAPAWFNLAYWYATEKKDGASAQPAYEKALSLGMPKDSAIEKAIKKTSK